MALTDMDHVDNGVYKTRTTCRACGDGWLESILHLGNQYLVNFVKDVDSELPRAPLHLVRCNGCGLLQLLHTTNPDLLFQTFWYRTGINETMRRAMRDIVEDALGYHDKGVWLDIGANDGYLLTQVPGTFTKIACDPAKNLRPELEAASNFVINDYFTSVHKELYDEGGKGRCNVITSAAMFYDIDEPGEFIDDIVECLTDDGIWINQLNDSPTMLKANAFDAICHEHLCYYDLVSLARLYDEHGLAIVSVSYNDVNGGSVRVVAQKKGTVEHPYEPGPDEAVSSDDALKFADRVAKWRVRMLEFLQSCEERVWLYGASTKGCVLLQYLGANSYFLGIADRNPAKVGLRMAGSWIRIHSEDAMRATDPKTVMVLPWAFRNEFIERERGMLDGGAVMVFPLPNIEVVL